MAQSSRSTYSSDSGGSPGGSPGHRTYMCKVCGNLFTSGQSLGGHMNVHRKQDRGSPPQSSTPPQFSQGEYNSPGVESQQPVAYKGVRYRKEQNKWVAEIRPPRATKTWWLGTYSTPEEAAYAYDVAITYFGSESSLNFNGHPVYEQIPTISTELQRQDFAAELRKVVKKYGKLAMESGTTMTTAPAASISTAGEAGEPVLGWDDFTAPQEISSSGWAEHFPFDFEETAPMTAPESSYQLPDYDQANSYYGYGGYPQQYNWPSFHGYDDYYYP